MKFINNSDDGSSYTVKSDSGKIYTINHVPNYDNPEIDLWECTCSGYKYRGDCKHLQRFFEVLPELKS